MLTLLWNSASPASTFQEGLQAYENKDYTAAIQYLKVAESQGVPDTRIHYYLADALVKANRLEEARSEYLKIIALSPQSEAARLSTIGLALIDQYQSTHWKSSLRPSSGATAGDTLSGLQTKGPNYLAEVAVNGQVVRWSPQTFPLKLYIEQRPSSVRNFEQTFVSQVQRAMEVWVKALDNRLSYVLVNTPNNADIRVTWVNSIDTQGHQSTEGTTYTSGLTVPNLEQDKLVNMEVRLATFDIANHPQTAKTIYSVALHELGHALGVRGHSKDPKDVMYPENEGVLALSRSDINTIRLLYAQPADMTNLPSAQPQSDPAHEKQRAEKLEKAILNSEALVKAQENNLNWNNLGNLYFQKARQLKRQGQLEEATALFSKSLDAFEHALKLEPKDSRAFFNESVVYQERVQYQEALRTIELAIKYDPRESKYYMDKAWILTNLNRRAEAKNALSEYLLREPSQAQSESVQKIKTKLAQQNN